MRAQRFKVGDLIRATCNGYPEDGKLFTIVEVLEYCGNSCGMNYMLAGADNYNTISARCGWADQCVSPPGTPHMGDLVFVSGCVGTVGAQSGEDFEIRSGDFIKWFHVSELKLLPSNYPAKDSDQTCQQHDNILDELKDCKSELAKFKNNAQSTVPGFWKKQYDRSWFNDRHTTSKGDAFCKRLVMLGILTMVTFTFTGLPALAYYDEVVWRVERDVSAMEVPVQLKHLTKRRWL